MVHLLLVLQLTNASHRSLLRAYDNDLLSYIPFKLAHPLNQQAHLRLVYTTSDDDE